MSKELALPTNICIGFHPYHECPYGCTCADCSINSDDSIIEYFDECLDEYLDEIFD